MLDWSCRAVYLPFGWHCRLVVYDVADLVVSKARSVMLLGHQFYPNWFLDLVATVSVMFHLLFSFSVI